MRGAVELSNIHNIVLVFQNCRFVVVNIEIVGSGEDGHDAGEAGRSSFSVHSISSVLGFVSSNDGEQVVLLEECAGGRVREKERATADVVMQEEITRLFLAKVLEGIGPEDITHKTLGWGFSETIDLNP